MLAISLAIYNDVLETANTITDKAVDVLGNIPVIKNVSFSIVRALDLENQAAEVVPKISFLLLLLIAMIAPWFIKNTAHIVVVLYRTIFKKLRTGILMKVLRRA